MMTPEEVLKFADSTSEALEKIPFVKVVLPPNRFSPDLLLEYHNRGYEVEMTEEGGRVKLVVRKGVG